MTKLTRTDCQRDNVKVECVNASTLGFGQRWCKCGYWIMYEVDGFSYVGRVIGRVTCKGGILIEVAQANLDLSHVYIRWVLPHQVREIRKNPPRSVFKFFASEDWKPETIFPALEYGVSDLHDQMEKVD